MREAGDALAGHETFFMGEMIQRRVAENAEGRREWLTAKGSSRMSPNLNVSDRWL